MGKASWWEQSIAVAFVAGLLALLLVNTAFGNRPVSGNLVIRIESDFPPIAGGDGSVTGFRFRVDRKWRLGGEEIGYVNARCQMR